MGSLIIRIVIELLEGYENIENKNNGVSEIKNMVKVSRIL